MRYVLADVLDIDENSHMLLRASEDIVRDFIRTGFRTVEIRIDDGRTISGEQRRKIFAIIGDIADWSGYVPDDIRKLLTWRYCGENDVAPFSLSNTDMTTAREYINYLIEFCFRYDIPTTDTLLNRADEIGKYIYLCLEYRKCCICGKKAQIHHFTGSRVGMGNNRNEIHNMGRDALPLCAEHHAEAHANGDLLLCDKWHIEPVKLDEYLCKTLGLRK